MSGVVGWKVWPVSNFAQQHAPTLVKVLWNWPLVFYKNLFKGKWSLAKRYFKQNYCHACHTKFAVFFPLPSCCLSSLMMKYWPGPLCRKKRNVLSFLGLTETILWRKKRSKLLLHMLETFRFNFKDEYVYGRDPFNQNFRKFRSKTQWIGLVQPEKFRKNGPPFEVDHFSRSDRLEFWLNGSPPLSSAGVQTNVILARKRDRRRYSTTSFSENVVVAETS